jgi:Mn2+-dependent serine/threonine protein kinase
MASNSTDKTKGKIQVPFSCLPSKKGVYFRESSFFSQYGVDKLPSPAKIRSLQKEQDFGYPPPMRFPEMRLLVKYGRLINVGEGQCLWIIRQFLQDSVPVPEIYGWIVDGDETFIYMELLDGNTLQERWTSLSNVDRARLCGELRDMVSSLRRLEQLLNEKFLGTCYEWSSRSYCE